MHCRWHQRDDDNDNDMTPVALKILDGRHSERWLWVHFALLLGLRLPGLSRGI